MTDQNWGHGKVAMIAGYAMKVSSIPLIGMSFISVPDVNDACPMKENKVIAEKTDVQKFNIGTQNEGKSKGSSFDLWDEKWITMLIPIPEEKITCPAASRQICKVNNFDQSAVNK